MLVGGSKCALADEDCRGRLEFHHAVKQQRLKREFKYGAWWSAANGRWHPAHRTDPAPHATRGVTLDTILADHRNRIWLCSHHHELVTNGRLEVTLPQSVWDFAKEFGLTAMLENDLARRSAA